MIDRLEQRVLLAGTVIISDLFTGGPAYAGKNISGRTPTTTDLPGGVYNLAAGFEYDQQVLGTGNGSYSTSAYFHNVGGTAISLASNGSYTKPTAFNISSQIGFEVSSGYVSDAIVGFYSAIPASGNQNDLQNFSGLRLDTNGGLTLIANGSSVKTIAFTGTYTPTSYLTLSYSINTLTGSIDSISLAGSSSDYTQFTTNVFTNAATTYGGIGGDNDPARVHFTSYQVSTSAVAVLGQGVSAVPLGNVTIASGITVAVPAPPRQADRSVLLLDSLTLASSNNNWQSRFDVSDDDLIVHNGNLANLTNQIKSGESSNWAGLGLTSSIAATDSTHLTALGIELNNDGTNQLIFGTGTALGSFDGQSPVLTDVLIKYAYYGDANLDGRVDGSDYTKIDNGYQHHLTGWSNGDFNDDGVIDGSDYTLIDNVFNTQGANLSTPTPAAKVVFGQGPSKVVAGATMSPSVTVDVEDSGGNVLQSNSSIVTLTIASGTGTLAGTTSVAAVNGVAVFSNLSLPNAGIFTIKASDTVLTPVVSSSFVVTVPVVLGGLSNTDPFGVASSYQSVGTYATWASKVAQAGAQWVRLFPEWNQVEPSQGTYDWSSVDAVTSTAAANNQYVSGLFYYNASWVNSNQGTFPTNNLSAWSSYISALTAHTAGKVEYWEVWNEPQNFAAGGTPQDYANVVIAAYNAAKAADPNAQIGLDVASVDINYLEQAIKDGAADHFDYITVHPYEVLGVVDQNWEGDYMSIVPTIRKMLAANDPSKTNAPIWFTELGEEIGTVNGPQTVTAASQAQDLIKAYTMGIAQGVTRIDWYQGEDGGGDTGYGLLDVNGNPTLSYTAMQSLTTYLGAAPQYQGWLQLNAMDDAFVFQGASSTVMAAWAPRNVTDTVTFTANVSVVNPSTGAITNLSAGSTLALTSAPVLVIGVPSGLLSQAQADKSQPFPWGGNYTNATSVSIQMGNVNTESGLHQLNANGTSQAVNVYGGPARLSNDSYADVYQTFEADPNFISYTTSTVNITVVARRDANNDSAGFNVGYESISGTQNAPSGWWTIPGNDQWYAHTFTVIDAEFDSKWGYNFYISSDSPSNGQFYIQSVAVTK